MIVSHLKTSRTSKAMMSEAPIHFSRYILDMNDSFPLFIFSFPFAVSTFLAFMTEVERAILVQVSGASTEVANWATHVLKKSLILRGCKKLCERKKVDLKPAEHQGQ
jgi:hypothetical protein